MGQVLRRAISKAQPTVERAAEGPVAAPLKPIRHLKYGDTDRPLRYVTPERRRPMLDDLNSLNDIIRRDHERAAAAGMQIRKPNRRPPWIDRGMTVEEYAEEIRRSRMTGTPPVQSSPQEINPGAEEPETGDWNRNHPNYKFMAEQLAKKIVSRPEFETKPVVDPGPKPQERGATRPKDHKIPGKLRLDELKQVFLLRYGVAEGEAKSLDVDTIAQRFNVDAEMLKKMFRYTSLPTPVKDEVEKQTARRSRLA